MSVHLRLSGDPDGIAATLAVLRSALDVATDSREYPNQRGFGVRVYAEVRPRMAAAGPVRGTAERVNDGHPAVTVAAAGREITR